MIVLPLQQVPNQQFDCICDGQRFSINIRTLNDALFFDIYLNGGALELGRKALDGVPLISRKYTGAKGKFVLIDIASTDRLPAWPLLGTEFVLAFLSESELV